MNIIKAVTAGKLGVESGNLTLKSILKGLVFGVPIALIATLPVPDPTSVWALLLAAVSLLLSFHAALNEKARHLVVVVVSLLVVYGSLLLIRPFTVGIEANLFVFILFGCVMFISYFMTNRIASKIALA
ncbi:hypothetical protein SAMN04487948_11673 [Halogranum amylolyticum]|uniref:Uncharacterized protein n=1 Tax=Halogranum amylolyticum TaxID=660520 RepID=A0A1H8VGJ3_9EURY|nr:hypothetical protein [Halogranum amylolyticum]SEP14404.1 hypothetical protein SAMN04487948_11673 [Halogranum amylolyticum]